MTLELLVIGALPSLAVMVIGWIFTRATRQADRVHGIDVRLVRAEEKIHGHGNRLQRADDTLEDLQKNMVRRDDFQAGLDALGQRIDDALRK